MINFYFEGEFAVLARQAAQVDEVWVVCDPVENSDRLLQGVRQTADLGRAAQLGRPSLQVQHCRNSPKSRPEMFNAAFHRNGTRRCSEEARKANRRIKVIVEWISVDFL